MDANFLCGKASMLDVALKGRLSALYITVTCLLRYAVAQMVEALH